MIMPADNMDAAKRNAALLEVLARIQTSCWAGDYTPEQRVQNIYALCQNITELVSDEEYDLWETLRTKK